MGIKDDWWLLQKWKPLQKFYTLHSKTPKKTSQKLTLSFLLGGAFPKNTHTFTSNPKKNGDPGNQPYQPRESTLPTLGINLTNLRINLTNPGKPVFWVAFLLATCGQQSKRAAKGKDARPRTWWNQSAKQQNEGWTGRPVGNGTFQISLKKIKEHQRCCFTFYFYLVRDMLFQNMFHFAEIFQKSICLCSSGNLSDVFVGHRIRRFSWHWACYPLVNWHSHGKSPFSMGNTSSKGPFSISILVYRRVTWTFRLEFRNLKHQHPKFMRQKFEQMDQHLQGVRSLPRPLQPWWSRRIIDETDLFYLGPGSPNTKLCLLVVGNPLYGSSQRLFFVWSWTSRVGICKKKPGKKQQTLTTYWVPWNLGWFWMQGILYA